MKVKVENHGELLELMSVLSARIDAVVSQTAIDELEVSLLGSLNPDASVAELEARLAGVPIKASVVRSQGVSASIDPSDTAA